MSDGNPLVADRVDTTSAFAGAFLLQDGEDLANAISSGDWAAGALAVTSTALDTVGAIIDPIGTLIANGLGWVLDHIEPLKSWFNDFTGDATEVASFSGTWGNTSGYIAQLADGYQGMLSQLDDMAGEGIDAYLGYASAVIANLRGAGEWSNAIAVGLQIASTLVQAVHDIVRDVLSQLVGSAISAAATTACTIGFGAPVAMAQFGTKVASLVAKVGRVVAKVLDALAQLARHLGPLGRMVAALLEKAAVFFRGGAPGELPHPLETETSVPTSPTRANGPDSPQTPRLGDLEVSDSPRVGDQEIRYGPELSEGWRPLDRDTIDQLPIVRDGSHMNPNGTLKPDIWYQTGEHEYLYHTDSNGHIDRFHAEELKLKDHEGRLRHDSNTPGKIPGEDHAGHLAGDWAGGSRKLDNLVSMFKDLNLKGYAELERRWRGVLGETPPGTVSVDVRIVTDPNTGRPTTFIVDEVVNGQWEQYPFDQ